MTKPSPQAFFLVGFACDEVCFVAIIAYVTVEGELEPSVGAVVLVVSGKRLKWHFFYLPVMFRGLPHFMHFSPKGACSVLHFAQITVSLWLQFWQ